MSPVTVHERAPVVVQVWPPLDVTLYPVMADPPLVAGADQVTRDWAFALLVAETPRGALGGPMGVTQDEVSPDDALEPAALLATTLNL